LLNACELLLTTVDVSRGETAKGAKSMVRPRRNRFRFLRSRTRHPPRAHCSHPDGLKLQHIGRVALTAGIRKTVVITPTQRLPSAHYSTQAATTHAKPPGSSGRVLCSLFFVWMANLRIAS